MFELELTIAYFNACFYIIYNYFKIINQAIIRKLINSNYLPYCSLPLAYFKACFYTNCKFLKFLIK